MGIWIIPQGKTDEALIYCNRIKLDEFITLEDSTKVEYAILNIFSKYEDDFDTEILGTYSTKEKAKIVMNEIRSYIKEERTDYVMPLDDNMAVTENVMPEEVEKCEIKFRIKTNVDIKELEKYGYRQVIRASDKHPFPDYFKKISDNKFIVANKGYEICEFESDVSGDLEELVCSFPPRIPLDKKDIKDLLDAGLVEESNDEKVK